MGMAVRLAMVLCLAGSLTACTTFPVGDISHRTIPSLSLSPLGASDAGLVVNNSNDRPGGSASPNAPPTVLTAMPAGIFIASSMLHLSKNGDGSISVLSDGRSGSLLRGLDPALVNPAVLPFLFPSCDAPLPR